MSALLEPVNVGRHNADESERLRVKEQQRRWYEANSEKKKEYVKAYYRANRQARILAAQEYRKKNPRVTLASRLKCQYGLSVSEFESMLSAQGRACAICGVVLNWSSKKTTPHVDHCHSTGAVRGILCSTCNTGLGYIERKGFLLAATEYLKGQR